MFKQLIRQFDAVPDEVEEEGKDEEVEEEEGDQEDSEEEEGEEEDERMTSSPFFAAATPGRLSTASTATSPSVSHLSRTSLSPTSPHTATRQLNLNDAPDEHETDDSKSDSKTRQNGRRSSTRRSVEAAVVAADDEEPKSAKSVKSAKRRSSGRVSFHIPEEQTEEEEKHDNDDQQSPADTLDDDNDDNGGEADMHDDNTHDNYEDSTQNPTSPSSASPIQPPLRLHRPRGRGGKRRETTRLIDEARRLGIVKEEEEVSLVSGRPKRNRTAPLEWWKGDKYEYAMEEDGIGNLMPIVKSVVRSAPTPEVKKRRGGRRAAGAGKAHKVNQATNSHLTSQII